MQACAINGLDLLCTKWIHTKYIERAYMPYYMSQMYASVCTYLHLHIKSTLTFKCDQGAAVFL